MAATPEPEVADLNQLRNELLTDLLKKNDKTAELGLKQPAEDTEVDDEELEMLRLEALKAKRSKAYESAQSSCEQQQDNGKRSAPGRFRYDRESDADDEEDDFQNESNIEDEDCVDGGVSDYEESPEREVEPGQVAVTSEAPETGEEPKTQVGSETATNSSNQAPTSSNFTDHSSFHHQQSARFPNEPRYQANYYPANQAPAPGKHDLRNLLSQKRSRFDNNLKQDIGPTRRFTKSPSPAELSYSEPITKPIEITGYFPPRSRFQKFQHNHNSSHHQTDWNASNRCIYRENARTAPRDMSSNETSSSEKYSNNDSARRARPRSRSRSRERDRSRSRSRTRKYHSSRSSEEDDSSSEDRSPSRARKKLRSAIVVPKSTSEERNLSSSKCGTGSRDRR